MLRGGNVVVLFLKATTSRAEERDTSTSKDTPSPSKGNPTTNKEDTAHSKTMDILFSLPRGTVLLS